MVLRARDPGDLRDVQDACGSSGERDDLSAQTPTECSRTTVSRSARPTALRSISRSQPIAPRRPSMSLVLELELGREQRVERRVRRDHREAGRSRLVHDLVRRARTHVVDETRPPPRRDREPRGAARARGCRRGRAGRGRSRVARARSGGAAPPPWSTARDDQRDAADGCHRTDDRSRGLSPATFGRGRAGSAARARGASTHSSAEMSIPWPIATTFRERKRERALVDAENGR